MTGPTTRDIEKELEKLENQNAGVPPFHVVGRSEQADLTATEYEDRYGFSPEESPGLVVYLPESVDRY